MPATSKPRKKYRRGRVNVPMTAPAHRRLALELHLAVEALVLAPSPETYNTLTKMLAALATAGLACEALDIANNTMDAIVSRFERVGKVGLKDEESTALRRAVASLDGRMVRLPVNKLAEAVAQIEVYFAAAGVAGAA
ncbi:hypothetical protein FHW58_003435 [Duganella sp. 1224]|uniref:hypothetical protein n=1 Tax=Duganella sp. 1224 TaxID=2587052 RepID=UPI0015C87229|nr:hypothetical protein [Duganella sp. 1224]NYE62220.1 hypothetical protein [Duganella sp. 1224]